MILTSTLTASLTHGAEVAQKTWDQFRGPAGSGVIESAQPPTVIESAHLAWKTPLPAGLSSPVSYGNQIFLTGCDKSRLFTIALNRQDGRELWRRETPEAPLQRVHKANTHASPSALVDAKNVYVYFGSYGLVAYRHDGKELWKRPLEPSKSLYGASSSPIAYKELLLLVTDDDANLENSRLSRSRVMAFSRATGELVWETARPFLRSGWSTPAIWSHEDGDELVVLGHGRVVGYNPLTGEEKWFAKGFSRETIAIPVQGKGRVYISSAQLGGVSDAEIDPKPFWKSMLQFDENKDGKVGRDEITKDFTWPLRPELPLGHPGWGIPLPSDPARRRDRQQGIFGWADKNRDNLWTEEELSSHITNRPGKPILMAITPGGRGELGKDHIAWELNRSVPEIPSPLFYRDQIYMVRNGGTLAAVNPETGKLSYRGRLGGTGQYSASPIAANGHIYLLSDEGTLSVVKAGDKFEMAHHFQLPEPASVTPALDHETLYVRGTGHLWAYRRR
ncbi:MAG: PQQ-like beta-propeller repeat protein [Roseibacillus sp.]|nr:PQQ-like beta-propeller repeat protein [Roseibacillus sp.]